MRTENLFALLLGVFLALAPTTLLAAADGSLDASFGSGGSVTTAFFTSSDQGYSVAVQADGRILVAGYTYTGANNDFAVARYNTDGSLDMSFDTDGKVSTDFAGGHDFGYSVAVQADGKILMAGTDNLDFAIVRYNNDGSLDMSFDSDGKLTTDIAGGQDAARSVIVQADGRILVAGYGVVGSDYDFAVVRYNTDGSLDTSFDSDGKVTTDIGGRSDQGLSVAIQADGKILVGGSSYVGSSTDFAVARYNTDGSLDTSFDSDGTVTTDFAAGSDQGYGIAVQADGKILVAGDVWLGSFDDFGLARYNTDGSLDLSFDSDGKVTTDFAAGYDAGYSVALQSDGKIVIAGAASAGSFGLARYNADGSLDTSFDSDGKVTTDIGGFNLARSIAIQSDGKILVAGVANNDFGLARYNASAAAPNLAPTFLKGADVGAKPDAINPTPVTVAGWATSIDPGAPGETGQTVSFIVTGNDNPGLFATPPAVASSGPGTYPAATLTFSLAPGATGEANVTLVAQDDGAGAPQSAPQTFTIAAFEVQPFAGDVVIADRGPRVFDGKVMLVHHTATPTQNLLTDALVDPYDIAVDAAGDYLVIDYETIVSSKGRGNQGLFKVDAVSLAVSTVSVGQGFVVPVGVAVEAGGTIVVLDAEREPNNGKLIRIDPMQAPSSNQTPLTPSSGAYELYWSTGMTVAPAGAPNAGKIYVCDVGSHPRDTIPRKIVEVDPATGNHTVVKQAVSADGTLVFPVGVDVDPASGDLVIADAFAKTVWRLNPGDGTLTPLSTSAQFNQPTHVAISGNLGTGTVWVTDAIANGAAGTKYLHRIDTTNADPTGNTMIFTMDGIMEEPRGIEVLP